MATQTNPLIRCLPLIKRISARVGARASLTRHLGVPCEIVVRCTHGEVAIALDDDEPGHYDVDETWVDVGDGRALAQAIAHASAPNDGRRDEDGRREMAIEAGMAHGCDGYNDTMGY